MQFAAGGFYMCIILVFANLFDRYCKFFFEMSPLYGEGQNAALHMREHGGTGLRGGL